jgi:thiol-disulfide isomerase/thioredoxin
MNIFSGDTMRKLFIVFTIVTALFLFGCTQAGTETPETTTVTDWKTAEFTDVATNETFTINQFAGTPVLVESFAVWCPTCTSQQNQMKELHEIVGDTVVSISLDTDPNEDVSVVQEHITTNGFNWLYAVSPAKVTQALINEFGVGIVNAPAAPVVLICADQSSRLLPRGVKTADELQAELAVGC